MFSLPNDRPALMGILNVTPDSFSDGGLHFSMENAVSRGIAMMEEGADLIDVGGESTRPGALPVDADEEIQRAVPVVRELVRQGAPVSIDTMKPEVAEAALDAGAFLVNDVSGFRGEGLRRLVQDRQPWVCVMHMLGEPRTMQQEPSYADVVGEVREYLVATAESLGLPKEQIWIDPGIGFGKTVDHNRHLLQDLGAFVDTGYPVLIGVSRKSFIGKVLGGLPADDRLEGTLAVQVAAQLKGVRVIRAHDIRASKRAIQMTRWVVSKS